MATRHKVPDQDVGISKTLSWLLRHQAEKEGFRFLRGGFLFVEDILKHDKFKMVSVDDIERIVATNEKKRFALETDTDTGKLKIRANQGHSVQVEGLELFPVFDWEKFPTVIHGTNEKAIQFIKEQGLKRMARTHIHFAAGFPGENRVISGMRQSCTVIIYIDLKMAIQDGFKFFQSVNGVILCQGNENGVLPPMYFDKIVYRDTGNKIPFSKDQSASLSSACLESSLEQLEHLADEIEDHKRKGRKKK